MLELNYVKTDVCPCGNFKAKREFYTCGRYIVEMVKHKYPNSDETVTEFVISQSRESRGCYKYIPEIFYDCWDTKEFRIQTTSYGSLLPEEIDEVIAGLQEAQEVIKIIKENLIK